MKWVQDTGSMGDPFRPHLRLSSSSAWAKANGHRCHSNAVARFVHLPPQRLLVEGRNPSNHFHGLGQIPIKF